MNPGVDDWPGQFLAGIERAAQHWLARLREHPMLAPAVWAADGGHALRALTWCADCGRYNELAADLAVALAQNMMQRGHWHEWETLLRRVFDRVGPALDPDRLWELTHVLGQPLLRLHRFAEAIALAERNYQLAAARGDLGRRQAALSRLAEIHLMAEAFDRALPYAEAATALAAARGDPVGEADGLIGAARALMELGDLPEAERRLARALALTTATGSLAFQAKTHIFLGHAARLAGDWAAALAQFRAALPLVSAIGDAVGVGTVLSNIGWALTYLGGWEEGAAALTEAIRLLARHGNTPAEAVARQRLAELRQRAAENRAG
jgi:tetratricopeptide (TPR) repeat protein